MDIGRRQRSRDATAHDRGAAPDTPRPSIGADDVARLESDHVERARRADIAAAEALVPTSPGDARAQVQVADASAHLRTAVRIRPNDDRVRFNYANLLQASGRSDEAIAEFRRAVQLNPDNADARFNLAVLLGPRNQLDEAITHLRQVIEINPRNADAHRNLAVGLSRRLQPDSAAAREHLNALLKASGKPVSR